MKFCENTDKQTPQTHKHTNTQTHKQTNKQTHKQTWALQYLALPLWGRGNDPLHVANTLDNQFVHAADGISKDDFNTIDDDFNSIISCHWNTGCIKRMHDDMSRHNVHGFTFTEIDEDIVMNKYTDTVIVGFERKMPSL